MNEHDESNLGTWAILELMGHVKLAGYVTEEELFGGPIGRIDIPAGDEQKAVTQYFGGQSIYRLTPVREAIARAFARKNRPRPVQIWELAAPEPPPEIYEDAAPRGSIEEEEPKPDLNPEDYEF